MIEAIFNQGKEAYKKGIGIEKCPYPETSSDRLDWLAGWHDARLSEEMEEAIYS